MKVQASTSLLPKMAASYREWGEMQAAQGNETGAAAGLTAADALEEVASLRDALKEALGLLEHRVTWSGMPADVLRDRVDAARIAELRGLLKIG